jgi:uncharacterized protein (DUF1499 family)
MSEDAEFTVEIKMFAGPKRFNPATEAHRRYFKAIPLKGMANSPPDYFKTLCENSLAGFVTEVEIQEIELLGAQG